jgi:hypothetical protein
MQLINNELIYDAEDTPKVFDLTDWKYFLPVIKAVSVKITDVNQRGIYGEEPRRFALVTSEELTEEEKAAVLLAWTNFDATNAKVAEKKVATEELRISLGIKTKAYMGYLCEVNNLTVSDYESMLGDPTLTILDRLLLNGALESAKGILDSYSPTAYFVEGFKTTLSAKLAEYISQVNAFIAA